jgi:hypothetical protein
MDGSKLILENAHYLCLKDLPKNGKLMIFKTNKLVLVTEENIRFSKRVQTTWIQQVYQSLAKSLGLEASYYQPTFVFTFEDDNIILSMEYST